MALCLVFISSCASKSIHKDVDQYKEVAERLILNNDKGAKPIVLKEDAIELINLAKPILKKYTARNPKCNELLTFIMAKSTYMQNLSLSEIEDKFHDGNGLPKADETCYEPKELIVHPSTVVILSKSNLTAEGREQIKDEIEEVIGHLDILKDSL
ncbi:MAG: hypothetical protein ACJAT2_000630 [Bacteriovoracaceae bacterium]|jgi:hypothetical protein